MTETTERTEMNKKGISDPFKEFKIVGCQEQYTIGSAIGQIGDSEILLDNVLEPMVKLLDEYKNILHEATYVTSEY